MNELNIKKVLIKKRRERGLTQEDIARYFGISKSAVSKWETGQSYPDVLLLPQLATYYAISIDELLGYTPQLTNKQIRDYYRSFSDTFSIKNYDVVKDEIEEVIRNYYSCYPLLTAMAQLYLNKGIIITEKREELLKRSYEISEIVIENSRDTFLIEVSKGMNSSILLTRNEPSGVFEFLGDDVTISTEATRAMSLVQAYMMKGNINKANEICQVMIYQLVGSLMGMLQGYQQLNLSNKELSEKIYEQEKVIFKAFNLKDNTMNPTLAMHILGAQSFIVNGDEDKAVIAIKEYYKLIKGIKFPLLLNKNPYFNKIDSWIDENLYLGNTIPASEEEIKESLLKSVTENPAFKILGDRDDFKVIEKNIKKILGDD